MAADGGAGRARRCGCQSLRPLTDRLAAAGVWEKYLHCTRERWDGAWPAAKLRDFGVTRHQVVIFGGPGAGKTHLATAILGEWLERGGRGLWREVSSTLNDIKQAMHEGRAGARLEELVDRGHLLVLVGLMAQRRTDWSDSELSRVLRYRLGRRLPTVITANVADLVELDGIEPLLGSRWGGEIVIGLAGGDRRIGRERGPG